MYHTAPSEAQPAGAASDAAGVEIAPGPLAGVRVVDVTTARGELAGRLLADLGAEVVKVEPPAGAEARHLPPHSPGGSLLWAAAGLGKRSVVLDLDVEADRERLLALVRGADVFVESSDPEALAASGLDYARLAEVNPRLVYASITPFGQDGPRSGEASTDLTVEAAGGLVGLQGDGDRPPVPVGYPQASFHAAAQAAADIVIALNERAASGLGQHLDTSMQDAVVWTLLNATGYPPNEGREAPYTGDERTAERPRLGRLVLGTLNLIPCADGYVLVNVGAGAFGARVWREAVRWTAEHAVDDSAGIDLRLAEVDWSTWQTRIASGTVPEDLALAAVDAVWEAMARRPKRELIAWAVEHDLMVAPVNDIPDLVADPHLHARGYWTRVGGRLHPGAPVLLSRTPMAPRRPAPDLGEAQPHIDAWTAEAAPPAPPAPDGPRREAFDGLHVLDLSWIGVGPIITKALADHGATVVRVESATRPDILRLAPPFKDGVAGMDRAQFWADYNTSKLGLALNLATPGGIELALRLVAWADVVVDSFTPGTLLRLGVDAAALCEARPDLVWLSTCLRGQTGPDATFAGFGQQGSAIAGLHGITGWPDRPPAGTWGAYTDMVAPHYGVAALAAAILERRTTGLGQRIDLSQTETGIHFIEPLVLDYTVNGHVPTRPGHDSATACPHGVYAVRGHERYVAIAVETPQQWRALREVTALAAFEGGAYDTLTARIDARARIDAAVAAWCAPLDGHDVERRLLAAGVPASRVLRPGELYDDPQLRHRGFFVTHDHAVMGPTP
ncbi:MAG: CoA transferase, partial [Dehalococcoidia bacterium]